MGGGYSLTHGWGCNVYDNDYVYFVRSDGYGDCVNDAHDNIGSDECNGT